MKKISVFGNPFIGLFLRANEKICLLGKTLDEKIEKSIFFATTIRVSLADSDLIGVYSIMNSNGIILSKLTSDEEIRKLKNEIYERKIDLNIHRSLFSPGNNICVNDNGGIMNIKFKEEKKEIEDVLGVEMETMKINGILTIGSAVFATNKFFISHPKTSEEEFEKIKEILRVPGYCGTLNSGFPFPSLSIVGNSKGCIVGALTTGYEIFKLNEYW